MEDCLVSFIIFIILDVEIWFKLVIYKPLHNKTDKMTCEPSED